MTDEEHYRMVGRNEGLEEAAAYIEPKTPRPCDCEKCNCTDFKSFDVCAWDDMTNLAKAIRGMKACV